MRVLFLAGMKVFCVVIGEMRKQPHKKGPNKTISLFSFVTFFLFFSIIVSPENLFTSVYVLLAENIKQLKITVTR